MLIIQSAYLIAVKVKILGDGHDLIDRIFDIMQTIILLSITIFFFAFSNSVRKAFYANMNKKKIDS